MVAVKRVEQVEIHHQFAYALVIVAIIFADKISLPRAVERYSDAKQLVYIRNVTLECTPCYALVAIAFLHAVVHVIKQFASRYKPFALP